VNYVGLCRGMFCCRSTPANLEWWRECTSARAASTIAFVANEVILGDSIEKAKRYVDAKHKMSEAELEAK
jgi:hypothetical protein